MLGVDSWSDGEWFVCLRAMGFIGGVQILEGTIGDAGMKASIDDGCDEAWWDIKIREVSVRKLRGDREGQFQCLFFLLYLSTIDHSNSSCLFP